MLAGHVWKHLSARSFGAIDVLSEMIELNEWRNPGWITSVRDASDLVVAVDFGGDHQGAVYRAYSMLIADSSSGNEWDKARTKTRREALPDGREMSYKKLRDAVRARALSRFLKDGILLRGMLLNVLVQAGLRPFQPDPVQSTSSVVDTSVLAPHTLDRLSLVAHIGGMLLSCMSKEGQNVLWVSDQDEIAPNPQRHRIASNVLANVSSHYLRHDLNTFQFITLSSDEKSMRMADLVALTDLSAGALCDAIGDLATRGTLQADRLWRPLEPPTKSKAAPIIDWLGRTDGNLTRATFTLEPSSSPGRIQVRHLNIQSAD